MAEAINDLSFMVTGAYGKPVPKSMGSPIRLHLPWKYGFKSIKGIVKISFVTSGPLACGRLSNLLSMASGPM